MLTRVLPKNFLRQPAIQSPYPFYLLKTNDSQIAVSIESSYTLHL